MLPVHPPRDPADAVRGLSVLQLLRLRDRSARRGRAPQPPAIVGRDASLAVDKRRAVALPMPALSRCLLMRVARLVHPDCPHMPTQAVLRRVATMPRRGSALLPYPLWCGLPRMLQRRCLFACVVQSLHHILREALTACTLVNAREAPATNSSCRFSEWPPRPPSILGLRISQRFQTKFRRGFKRNLIIG